MNYLSFKSFKKNIGIINESNALSFIEFEVYLSNKN